MNRPSVLHLLNYGIAIATKRQSDTAITKTTTDLFTFLASNEEMTEHILSYLDPPYCCAKDRNVLLKCWKSLRGADDEEKAAHRAPGFTAEDDLRKGFGSDVVRWNDVDVEGGRVVGITWEGEGLRIHVPAVIGELKALRELILCENGISGHLP